MREASKQTKLRVRVDRGIFKRQTKDGETRYEVSFLDLDGRQRWMTVRRLSDARRLRAELVTRVASGQRVVPSKVTFAEFAADWLAQQETRLRPATLASYGSYIRLQLAPRLGQRTLSSITVDDVAALIADLEKGFRYRERNGRLTREQGPPYAGWTIRGVVQVLGRVLGRAARLGLVNANPVRRLEKEEWPRTTRRGIPSLDREAIGRLISWTPKKYRTLVALSILTGLRQSEALGLRWQDIDTRDGFIRVRVQLERSGRLVEPKTAAAKRDVPIPPSLARLLCEHKRTALARERANPTDFVFASETGGPLNHCNVVSRGLEKATATGGLPRLRWHDLRHLAASALIAEGTNVSYLSRVLGHSSPAITLSIYAHEFARAEHADHTRKRMEKAFGHLLSR